MSTRGGAGRREKHSCARIGIRTEDPRKSCKVESEENGEKEMGIRIQKEIQRRVKYAAFTLRVNWSCPS
jgi:hypothetical protein